MTDDEQVTKKPTRRRRKTAPVPAGDDGGTANGVRARRDYESEFTLGVPVVDAAEYATGKMQGFVCVRQYTPFAVGLTDRKCHAWKLDFAFPLYHTYVEIDGFHGSSRNSKGGHRTWTGFHRDREKSNALIFQGWNGLRFAPGHLQTAADVMYCARLFVIMTTGEGMEEFSEPVREQPRRASRKASPRHRPANQQHSQAAAN